MSYTNQDIINLVLSANNGIYMPVVVQKRIVEYVEVDKQKFLSYLKALSPLDKYDLYLTRKTRPI